MARARALAPAQQEMPALLATAPEQDSDAEGVDSEPELDTCVCGPLASQAVLALCCVPVLFTACCQVTLLNQNEQKALLYWGRYHGSLKAPGMYCINPCGVQMMSVSKKFTTLELKEIKCVDAKGSPVVVSAVVTMSLQSAKKACIDVEDPTEYVRLQASTVLKQVASRYPYSAPLGQPSLQTEGTHLSQELVQGLQSKVDVAGAVISNCQINDLSYAAEVAQVMLVKQQAEAMVEARRIIVSSAVEMADAAVSQLEAKGHRLSDAARERVTSNLLAVICSHQAPTPTLSLQ